MQNEVAPLGHIRGRDAVFAGALALAYFAVASVTIASFGTNTTPIWFANALAVAGLLRQEPRAWPITLAFLWIADALAVRTFGAGPAPIVALADTAEIVLAAGLIRRLGGPQAAFSGVVGLGWFIVVCLVAPIPSSFWGAAIFWWIENAPFIPGLLQWHSATALGLLVVCPFLLIWTTPELRQRLTRALILRTAALAAGLGGLAFIVFAKQSAVYIIATLPALLLLVWSSGLFGATAGTAVLLAVALWTTLKGGGAMVHLAHPATDLASQIQALQIYLAAAMLSSLPLAVVLRHHRELSKKLALVAEARAEFLAAMSHEIRTPMTGVLGMVDLLEAQDLPPKQASYVESIRASGRHLLHIINDILDFSRIETGKIDLEHVDFSLPLILERLRSLLNPMAMERGIELHFELAEHSPPVLRGDPTRLKQVLLNLAGNAIKFTDNGSVSLVVSYDRHDRGWLFRFEVRDTGIGMSTETQAQLFTAFMQADHSTRREYGGTGLGLAISKRLVEAMGGTIGVDSEEGVGSVFWFEVPFAEGYAIQSPVADAALAAPLAPRRILVAEDVELNRDIIRTVLERDGHDVVFAWNGRQAVELVREFPFDLVLMDIQMPLMDGVEATREIRKLEGRAADVPIVALTANVMVAEQDKCLKAGMNDVLMKPIEWERVREVIRQYEARATGVSWDNALVSSYAPRTAEAGILPQQALQDRADSPEFVEPTFLKVRELIPAERLNGYVDSLEADVELLAAVAVSEDATRVRGLAHKIVSQAGMLGLMRLSRNAAQLEDALRDGTRVEEALNKFRESSSDVAQKLRPLLRGD